MGLHSEGLGDLVEPVNADAVFAPFDRAHVSSIDPCGMRQRLLRHATGNSQR